ncbi:MAG: hypothetical protein IJW27_01015 [Clostridia bacterium]|nr:hypothetical protein [Clostridia bacterium]
MNEFLTYEYAVAPPKKKKMKVLLILGYALYALILLVLIATVGKLFLPLFAIVPLTLWVIIFFTWPYTVPEYEYSMTSGELTFSVIYGGRIRKKRFEAKIKDMDIIAPLSEPYSRKIDEYKPTCSYEGASSHQSEDIYFALFENDNGEKCIYYFEATERALKILRHYNPKTVGKKVRF